MRAGAGIREAADQQVRPVASGRGTVVLDEYVVADNCRLRSLGHAGKSGASPLKFDLHAITDRIQNQIVLYDPGDKGLAAVGISEIERRACSDDRVAADDPIPGRSIGRDPIVLLIGPGADDQVIVEHDVMRRRMRCDWRLDPIRARNAAAVDREIADDNVAQIDNLDCILDPAAPTITARGPVAGPVMVMQRPGAPLMCAILSSRYGPGERSSVSPGLSVGSNLR